MKFVSASARENVDKKPFEVEAKLDTGLIRKVRRIEEDEIIYSMEYDAHEVGNPTNFPFRCSAMDIYARLTDSDIYIGAVARFAYDEEHALFEDYSLYGDVEFDIFLDESEKIRFLLALINKKEATE